MTRIESPTVSLNSAATDVARDFQDWTTFGELLSSGPVSEFQADGDRCSFKVTGGVSIHLVRTSDPGLTEGQVLTLATEAPTPVKFTLDVNVVTAGEGCTCQVGCDADLNPFTKMMVEPALKGLFGQMADTLQSRY
ncbi:MAG: hypothetical protein O2990_01890 [Bacteroidetes bacterium]|nr:hypothetical protein [Bacteroidota bacterium]